MRTPNDRETCPFYRGLLTINVIFSLMACQRFFPLVTIYIFSRLKESALEHKSAILNFFICQFQKQSEDRDGYEDLCTAMVNFSLEDPLFSPSDSSSDISSNGTDYNVNENSQVIQRMKLNEFLSSCNATKIGPCKKRWEEASLRTKRNRVTKAKDSVVAALNVIAPGDSGFLWTALKTSNSVEKALNISPHNSKYLEALAEAYANASSWDTRRQILSIMADLAPLEIIRQYIPGLTEYRFKIARKHKLKYGRGVPLPLSKSTRMRINVTQLDHFLSFITSPHIIQDLPFGLQYLRLSSGEVLETPNVIRCMIPQRIVQQYKQFCAESDFEPFGESTMLRILSCCSATVRKSLQGLDYIAAEGAKAFDDLQGLIERLERTDVDRKILTQSKKDLKEAKHYLKTDYKVLSFVSEQFAQKTATIMYSKFVSCNELLLLSVSFFLFFLPLFLSFFLFSFLPSFLANCMHSLLSFLFSFSYLIKLSLFFQLFLGAHYRGIRGC